MRDPVSYPAGRVARTPAILALALACLAAPAGAQPASKQPPAIVSPGQGGQPDIIPIGWAKLCRKFTATSVNKDGKEVNQDLNICLTKNETVFADSGSLRSSAAVRQIDGDPKQYLMITVPLEMELQAGMRAAVFPKDLWEKTQKGEQLSKADEAKLKQLAPVYTQCSAVGCDGELEATPQLINDLKAGGALMVFAFKGGQPIPFPIPLDGFGKAYTDAPTNEESYNNARLRLMQQVGQASKGAAVAPKR